VVCHKLEEILDKALDKAIENDNLEAAEKYLNKEGVLTFGIESIYFEEDNSGIEYVSLGETYNNTIIKNENNEYEICSWGDWYEDIIRTYEERSGKKKCPNCGAFSDDRHACTYCDYIF